MVPKTLLITGFMPFGTESRNPSWEAVKALPEQIGGWKLMKLLLPVEYGRAALLAQNAAVECHADAILCAGLAAGRTAVTPEFVGVNVRDASIPDNAGNRPSHTPVVVGAPAAYFSTLPVREMVAALQAAGLPCALSYSAGVFVCNDLLYTLLHRYDGTDVRVGFVHIPYLPEQAGEGVASLPLNETVRGLTAVIEVL